MAMIVGQYERGGDNLEKAQKSERQPLQVGGRGGQERLDAHVLKTAPDCSRESMPSLRLAVVSFGAPTMSPVEFPVLGRPVLPSATRSKERRIGALYEAFAPAEAPRILRRFKFHFNPKHASWLNMVECELSVLQRQCLGRRIHDPERLRNEIAAWQKRRNKTRARIKWMFTTDKARAKLGPLSSHPQRVKITVMNH